MLSKHLIGTNQLVVTKGLEEPDPVVKSQVVVVLGIQRVGITYE